MSGLVSEGDRITNLDRKVLSHILSRLPTRDCVRTSILSRTWEYKWTYLYNVDICDYDKYFQIPNPTMDDFLKVMDVTKIGPLINLMDKILLHCQGLKGFRFKCFKSVDPILMQTWISHLLLRHNLETLEVICHRSDTVFPSDLFNSVSLRKVNLRFRVCTLNVLFNNCAPNLTTLELHRVEIVNESPNTSTMTFTFPSLETFTAKSCNWLNVKCVEIHAPSLTKFISSPRLCRNEDYDYSFVIVAPRLNEFECSYGLPEKFIMDGSSIVSASIRASCQPQLCEIVGLRVRTLLDEFTNLEDLELSNSTVEVLRLAPPLGRIDKLRQLTLHAYSVEQLFDWLHAAPMLKILSINTGEWVDYDYDYGEMESVPSCVVSHLEEVQFPGFKTKTPAEYNLVKFFMEKGEQLKKICIDNLYRDELKQVTELLLTFPKRSPCLDIDLCIGRRQCSR